MTHTSNSLQPHMKPCIECYAVLPIENYGLSRVESDGHQKQCKLCQNEYAIARRAKRKGSSYIQDPFAFTRSIKLQNSTVLEHALSYVDSFECYACTPHEPAIYRVSFAPHKYGRCMIIHEIDGLNETSTETPPAGDVSSEANITTPPADSVRTLYYREYVYSPGEELIMASQLLAILKMKRLRLEFSETDLLDSKQLIYFLE